MGWGPASEHFARDVVRWWHPGRHLEAAVTGEILLRKMMDLPHWEFSLVPGSADVRGRWGAR